MSVGGTINVTRLIDEGRIGRSQIVAIALCSLVAFLDGIDSQSIAIAAPIIADELKLTQVALGPLFSASLLGAMIGAMTFGPLGDRFGRKRMLIAATVIFGVFTLATPMAPSYGPLLAVRFAGGIGLGGATPCFIALACEFAPARSRAMVASMIYAAFPLGASVGGFVNSFILSTFGWQMIFWVGGVLPIAAVAALIIWLPESLAYLTTAGRDSARAAQVVRRLWPDVPAHARFVSDEVRMEGVPLKHLFADGFAARTALLWIPFFMAFATLALTVIWTPLLLRDNGISPAQASIVLGFNGIGGLIGMAIAGRLMERLGVAASLVPSLVLGAMATAMLASAATSVMEMSIAMFLIGVFVGIGASGSIGLAALIYPTAIRSSGVGWAMGMGRFGQVLAPLFAGAVLALGGSNGQLFLVASLAPLIGAASLFALHAMGRAQDSKEIVAAPADM